jgi:hypothetical protein
MNKDTLIGGVVIIVVLGLIVGWGALRPAPQATPVTGSYSEHTAYYDIDAVYATSTPLKSGTEAAVGDMQNFIIDTAKAFKGEFEHLTAEEAAFIGIREDRKPRLEISYATGAGPHTVSYMYAIYADTLGAHGNTTYKTFTFDPTSGKNLTLADLFIPEADYLKALSQLSRAKLPAVMGEYAVTSDIDRGTEPKEENFSNFFLTPSELVILFPAYQVAAYAAGPQALRISLAELTSILKPEYK